MASILLHNNREVDEIMNVEYTNGVNPVNPQDLNVNGPSTLDALLSKWGQDRNLFDLEETLSSLLQLLPSLNEKKFEKFQENGLLTILQRASHLQQQQLCLKLADWYVSHINADTKFRYTLEAMRHYAKAIEIGIVQNDPSVSDIHRRASYLIFSFADKEHEFESSEHYTQYISEKYWDAKDVFKRFFTKIDFEQKVTPDEIRNFQHSALRSFRSFFGTLVEDGITLLAPSSYISFLQPRVPQSYDIRAVGQEEGLPFSALELVILCEKEDASGYFKRLTELLQIQLASCGMFMNAANPIVTLSVSEELEEKDLRKILRSVSLYSKDITLFQHVLQKASGINFLEPITELTRFDLGQGIATVNSQLIDPLNHILEKIAHSYGIFETNTLVRIDLLLEQGCFTQESKELLKEVVGALYLLTIRLQDPEAIKLTSTEISLLEKTYLLLLRPLQSFKDVFQNIDLIPVAFNSKVRSLAVVEQIALHNCQIKASLDIHLDYFICLSTEPSDTLRESYFKTVKENLSPEDAHPIVEALLKVPNNSGLCLAFTYDIKKLEEGLSAITNKLHLENELIAITTTSTSLPRYLKFDLINMIMDGGDIRKTYDTSAHRVCRFSFKGFVFHFKQNPLNPLMEYAVHNLISRMGGQITPTSLLVRFDIFTAESKKSFPVLISQTIEGERLSEGWRTIEPNASYTWNLISAILTRPGKGNFSQYMIDNAGNLYCVDNSQCFVDLGENPSNFCAAPFSVLSLSTILDQNVLMQFTTLDVRSLLIGWIDTLIGKEKEYASLIKTKDVCSLFRKGTVRNLYLQILSLQKGILQASGKMTAGDLLKLLTCPSNKFLGTQVYKAYDNHQIMDAEERLKKATSGSNLKDKGKTKNSAESVPYSLEEAKAEVISEGLAHPSVDPMSRREVSRPAVIISPKQKSLFFPIEALQVLLDWSEKLEVEHILTHAGQGEETQLFSLLNRFMKLDPSSQVHKVLAANLTLSRIFSVAQANLSLTNLYNLTNALFNGDNLALPDQNIHGEFSHLLNACNVLTETMRRFQDENGNIIENEIIQLLKDEKLKEFLSQEKVCDQIAALCATAQVPNFDAETVKQALKLFTQLQNVILTAGRAKIGTFSDLGKYLLINNTEGCVHLMQELVPLIGKLKDVFAVFLKPQIVAIHLLALPVVIEILDDRKMRSLSSILQGIAAPAIPLKFSPCKTHFQQYNDQAVGKFIDSPLTQYIKSCSLEKYRFSHKKTSYSDNSVGVIHVDFNNLLFEDFSFQSSTFMDFQMKDCVFLNCDFSNVIFSGKIQFSRVYIDARTASTFLPSLKKSLGTVTFSEERLSIEGKLSIESEREIILITLENSESNPVQEIPEELLPFLNSQYCNWSKPSTHKEVDYLPIFEEPIISKKTGGKTFTNEPNEFNEPPSYMSMLVGGIGTFAQMGLDTLKEYALLSPENFEEEIYSKNTEEIKECSALEIKLKELEEKYQKLSDGQTKADKSQVEQLERLEGQVKNVHAALEALQTDRKRKLLIQGERQKLLERRDQVTHYYQKFLKELSFALQAVMLLQNSLRLIEPNTGRIATIANKQQKYGKLVEACQDPHVASRVGRFFGTVSDYFIEYVDYAKVAASCIPFEIVSSAVEKGLDFSRKVHDESKLAKSSAAFAGVTQRQLEKIADEIARKLSFAYEEQILLLDDHGAIQFAECGTLRVIAALFNGYISNPDTLISDVILAIRRLEVNQEKQILHGLVEIPFTTIYLKNKTNKEICYTEDFLYRQSGIAFQKNERWRFYSNDKKGHDHPYPHKTKTYASKIGYMHVTEEEWEKHFRLSVTPDVIRIELPRSSKANPEPVKPVITNAPIEPKEKFNDQKTKLLEHLEVSDKLKDQRIKHLEEKVELLERMIKLPDDKQKK